MWTWNVIEASHLRSHWTCGSDCIRQWIIWASDRASERASERCYIGIYVNLSLCLMKWICWCALNDLKIEFIGNNLHNVWGQWGIQQTQATKHANTMCFVVCIDLIVCRRGQLNYLMIDLFIFILLTAQKIIEFAKMSIIIMWREKKHPIYKCRRHRPSSKLFARHIRLILGKSCFSLH